MEGIPEINRNQSTAQDSVTGAPPPPTEVKIRTMNSDLSGMAASGGGLPKFENVKVSGLSLAKKDDNITTQKKNNAIMAVVITAGAVVLLGVLGYIAYTILK